MLANFNVTGAGRRRAPFTISTITQQTLKDLSSDTAIRYFFNSDPGNAETF